MRNTTRSLFAVLLILALALPSAGCGRKPENVSPPEGSDGENFPRTYPSS